MGNRIPQADLSSIPDKIRYLFEVADIARMFEFMEKRYHLHPDWHKQFKADLKKTPKDLPEQEFFFRWTTEHLNYALQVLVRRKANIIEDIAMYLLRKRIDEKNKEQDNRVKFYRGDQWKKEPNRM